MNPHFRPYIDFETTWQCWGLGVTVFFRRWPGKRFPCEVFINMGPWTLSFGWRLRHVVDVDSEKQFWTSVEKGRQ